MAEFTLKQTCGACPEAYDVYRGDEYVGYLRLRHGYFAAVLDRGGTRVVYEGDPEGDGVFEYEERERFLNEGCLALKAALAAEEGEEEDDRIFKFA